MFVEIARLFIVLLGSLAGLSLGHQYDAAHHSAAGTGAVLGGVLGTLAGYVGGGVTGRLLERAFGVVEERIDRFPGPKVFAGAIGGAVGGLAGALVAVPLVGIFHSAPAYVGGGLLVWTMATLGLRVAARKSDELFALAGLSTRPLVRSAPYRVADGYIVDTSAVMDGYLQGLVRAGLLDQELFVPRFVLDELQGFADARETPQARRARRGLEMLDAMRRDGLVRLRVLDDEVPEREQVDAKLVVLAKRLELRLLTSDGTLQRVAELQDVPVCNLRKLWSELSPGAQPGDVVIVELVRPGKEPGQGVGYLDDGSMVVVNDAAALVGSGEIEVEIATAVPTALGRLLFARVASAGAGNQGGSQLRQSSIPSGA